jgi:hypothetical protein
MGPAPQPRSRYGDQASAVTVVAEPDDRGRPEFVAAPVQIQLAIEKKELTPGVLVLMVGDPDAACRAGTDSPAPRLRARSC